MKARQEPAADSVEALPSTPKLDRPGKPNGRYHGKYDPAEFNVPASDHKGHSERLWCRVQPSMDREVDTIVSSRKWPFKTKGDFCRWAVWEGIKKIHGMEPVPNSMLVVAEAMIRTAQATESWITFQKSVDQAEHTVKMLMGVGNEREVWKLLSSLRSMVEGMEEENWRQSYMDEFKKRFGHILAQQKGKAVPLNRMRKTTEAEQ